MGSSVEINYQNALLALLPTGAAWSKDDGSELNKLMAGIAEEFARIDQRAADLLDESHPSTTNELFEEWENEYNLPDPCSGVDPSFQERLTALIQTYRMQGGQSRSFFTEIAQIMGYDITITEYSPRRFGEHYGNLYGGENWAFTWHVNAASIDLKTENNARLECVFNRLKRAHMHIIFSYS